MFSSVGMTLRKEKTPKRTIFLDFSNVKGNPYLAEVKGLLSTSKEDPYGMVGYSTKNSGAKKAPIARGTTRGTKRACPDSEERQDAAPSGAPPGEDIVYVRVVSEEVPAKRLKKADKKEKARMKAAAKAKELEDAAAKKKARRERKKAKKAAEAEETAMKAAAAQEAPALLTRE